MPLFELADLLRCLELNRLDDASFEAPNLPMDYYRVFGGQLLAQAIVAATALEPGKRVKSLHVTFPKEGERDATTEIRVPAVSGGRTFASRAVEVVQGERPILLGTVVLEAAEEGPGHQVAVADAPPPDEAKPEDLQMIPWETRIVGGVDLAAREEGPPELALWMRAADSPADERVQRALLAHATDLTLIGTTLRAWPGFGQADSPEKIQTAVVSHSIWFHGPIDLRAWTRLQQESPVSGGGRGFGQGHALSADGRVLASYAQESMIRSRG